VGPEARPERGQAGAMWYKNAVIYSLDVETFMDSNGDGIGDFHGLTDRIDHLVNLGVDCVWLQPFHPTPNRDDGYDVADYYAVDPRLGSLGDFAEFSHGLKERGIRLLIDLVVNHTSDQHPWFKAACADPASPYRDFYIWSERKPADADEGMVFPGVQKSTWTLSKEAGAYYHHRFYEHQPDLNIANPAVRAEILKIMGFWLQLGVSGFRIDAAPFVIELTGRDGSRRQDEALYGFLREMHDFIAWRAGDAVMLAEANVPLDKIDDYFGDGDRLHMLFAFNVNQPMFLALARQQAEPLLAALQALPKIPRDGQWAQFLRGHDELDLGRLTERQRQEVFAAFGPEKRMQLYDRGIRRRLAPMLGNDRSRIELAHSLICSLPGSQVVRYGDEIGMGDDLSLKERLAVRTPMQWSDGPNGGFSTAPPKDVILPVIRKGEYGHERVNVGAQLYDRDSLLNSVQRLIRTRRSCPEVGWGELQPVEADHPAVFAHECRWDGRRVLIAHNLGAEDCRATLKLEGEQGARLVDLASDRPYARTTGPEVELAGFGYRWFRVEAAG
jgi:maltose alpha-D-glucosyltransferase/alpha-amylase